MGTEMSVSDPSFRSTVMFAARVSIPKETPVAKAVASGVPLVAVLLAIVIPVHVKVGSGELETASKTLLPAASTLLVMFVSSATTIHRSRTESYSIREENGVPVSVTPALVQNFVNDSESSNWPVVE